MDQLLSKIFRYIPEWVFVLILIGMGLTFFFFDNPLVSVCDAQIADFASGQSGKLFPRAVKVLNPTTNKVYSEDVLKKARQDCINSIGGMGCNKYFKIINGVLFDFKKLEPKCLNELSVKPAMVQTFDQYLSTMAKLAWGETAPRTQTEKKGWLGEPEVKSFCMVKSYYQLFYPPQRWDSLVQKTLSQLVEDPNKTEPIKTQEEVFKDELKSEADYEFKKAKMEIKKAYDLSLFSLDCLYYR